MQDKKQQLEPDIEQWTRSKLGKEYVKAVYYHPVYLTYMQSTSGETLDWKKHSWNQDCQDIDRFALSSLFFGFAMQRAGS